MVEELTRRDHEVTIFCPQIAESEKVEKLFRIHLRQFKRWKMGRYARMRNVKYLAYPFCLERMVTDAAADTPFDLIFSQHAISAVAAGKLKAKLKVPVMMNFPDFLTGFMETWPAWVAPRPLTQALKRFEISMPVRYDVDGVLTVSDTLAECFSERGYPSDRICPIYYGYDADKFSFIARTSDKNRPPVIVMHGSFDAHHLGEIALGAIGFVTKKRPEAVFRFVGRETASLQAFLRRAKREIAGFKFETTGFVPYGDVAKHLADATVGMVPYEESAGTHCAFVAKVVEYIASGLPSVCTSLKSIRRYFKNEPMIRFSEFNGEDFGRKIVSWLEESPLNWQIEACNSAARVQAELDWQPICRKAVNFIEEIYARSSK